MILSGCTSEKSQQHLKSSHLLNVVPGQSRRVLVVDRIVPDLWTIKVHQVVVALWLLHDLICGTAPEALRMHANSTMLPVVQHCPKKSPVPLVESFWNSKGLILPLSILHADGNVFLLHHAAHIMPHQAFLCTCVSFPAPDAERTWHEVYFAAPVMPPGLMPPSGLSIMKSTLQFGAYLQFSMDKV